MSRLPSGWKYLKLIEVAEIVSGATPKTEVEKYWNGNILWATPKDLGQLRSAEISDTERKITQAGYESCSTRLLPSGSVLLSSRAPIGHLAINIKPICTNQGFKSLIPKNNIFNRYLYWVLKASVVQLQGLGRGCTFDEISKGSVEKFEIPVPPLSEQCRIVARVEELTSRVEESRNTAIEREAHLDVLLQATYWRIIDGVEWEPLEKVASLVRRAVKTKPCEKYEEMGIRSFGKGTFKKPILTGKQIGNKHIYYIHKGDLVFNNVFAWEKAIAVAKEEDHGRVGSHRFITYVPREGKATSEFLCHHFLGERGIEDIRAASPGSAGRNRTLGLKKLEKILVPVPDYDEQKRFAELARRRQLVQQESAGIEEDMKSFTSALLVKAFRGEL
jgi:type I restriction enzyme S subunit